jgi:2-oxoglutarate ferredoxin oxidoreductase subunit delta
MAKKRFKLEFIPERCKECGICIAFCPRQNLREDEDGRPVLIDPENCSGCALCEYYCPDFAIRVEETEEGSKKQGAKTKKEE